MSHKDMADHFDMEQLTPEWESLCVFAVMIHQLLNPHASKTLHYTLTEEIQLFIQNDLDQTNKYIQANLPDSLIPRVKPTNRSLKTHQNNILRFISEFGFHLAASLPFPSDVFHPFALQAFDRITQISTDSSPTRLSKGIASRVVFEDIDGRLDIIPWMRGAGSNLWFTQAIDQIIKDRHQYHLLHLIYAQELDVNIDDFPFPHQPKVFKKIADTAQQIVDLHQVDTNFYTLDFTKFHDQIWKNTFSKIKINILAENGEVTIIKATPRFHHLEYYQDCSVSLNLAAASNALSIELLDPENVSVETRMRLIHMINGSLDFILQELQEFLPPTPKETPQTTSQKLPTHKKARKRSHRQPQAHRQKRRATRTPISSSMPKPPPDISAARQTHSRPINAHIPAAELAGYNPTVRDKIITAMTTYRDGNNPQFRIYKPRQSSSGLKVLSIRLYLFGKSHRILFDASDLKHPQYIDIIPRHELDTILKNL